ncbi:MAG: acetate--CoA ligase family protein [Kofleriaceae bacterium]
MSGRLALALATARPLALTGLPDDVQATVAGTTRARGLVGALGLPVDALAEAAAEGAVGGAWITAAGGAAAELVVAARAYAEAGRPLAVMVLAGRPGVEAAAAQAFLRAHGAAVFTDPDAWLEALVLLAIHRAPNGHRVALVAGADGFVAAAARTLGPDDGRRPAMTERAEPVAPTDAVLVERAAWTVEASELAVLRVPLCERAELLPEAPRGALVGLRPALAALTTVGRAVERTRTGLGPASRTARAELEVDEARLERQLGKRGPGDRRLGDHETKVLLSAYGVPITRQAVATSPSAAMRVATKAGFPVDVKPWGPDVGAEADGCPVEAGLTSAADVRRAFAAVLSRADLPIEGSAVIVRASPPAGREVRVRVTTLPALGPTVVVEVAGQPPEAAPAPLRLVDANALAATVVATRAGDAELDRVGLANLLRRASHLAVDHSDSVAELSLGRVIVAGRGGETVVVDAEARLR